MISPVFTDRHLFGVRRAWRRRSEIPDRPERNGSVEAPKWRPGQDCAYSRALLLRDRTPTTVPTGIRAVGNTRGGCAHPGPVAL